jgi:hypothetical protein
MLKPIAILTTLLALFWMVGCQAALPEQRPDDFRVRYEWWAGSMPPPYHYEYKIEIDPDGRGLIRFWPDYAGQGIPEWHEPFQVSEQELDELYHQMVELGLFRTNWRSVSQRDWPVGGESDALTARAGGREVKIPSYVISSQQDASNQIVRAVRETVPQEIWERLEAQRQEYMDNYSG